MNIKNKIIEALGGKTQRQYDEVQRKAKSEMDRANTMKALFKQSQHDLGVIRRKIECLQTGERWLEVEVDVSALPIWVKKNQNAVMRIVTASARKQLLEKIGPYILYWNNNGRYYAAIEVLSKYERPRKDE